MTNRFTLLILFSAIGLFTLGCGPDGPEFSPVNINGIIECYQGSGMEGVEVTASSDQATTVTTFTDSEGNYVLEGLNSGVEYTLDFYYEDDTPLDYEDVELFKDFLEFGGTNLNDFQLLMCDIGTGGIIGTQVYVTMIDYVEIGYVTGWRFATGDFAFPSPSNPDGTGQADQVVVTPWEDMTIDMVGLKLGDLNESSCD